MNMSEQLRAQLMDKVGHAWQSHSRISTCRRRLSWSANRVPCGVTSLACGPWLLGPICQWLWGGHNCWEFGGDTADVFLQKLKPFCLRHVGPSGITVWVAVHNDQRTAVRLIGVVLWFIMKTLNLYKFLNSCPNQLLFFVNFLENVHIANGFNFVECIQFDFIP